VQKVINMCNNFHFTTKSKKFRIAEKNQHSHAEKQVWIILAVNRNKAVLPFQCCDTSRKTILHIPKDTPPKID